MSIAGGPLPVPPGLVVKATQAGGPMIPKVTASTLTTNDPLLQAGLPALKTLSWLAQNAIWQKVLRMSSCLRLVYTLKSVPRKHHATYYLEVDYFQAAIYIVNTRERNKYV